ncbi:MAG TPA: hypothetical protein VK663_10260 [Burkholderiales bacterium]|nr:hypothetical protein [Burkholderiales bacterium]
MKLREIAHCRAGDKGNTLNVSVIAYDERDFRWLQDQLTLERVRSAYANLVKGKIERYELPHIGALNFVLHDALAGGVTTSLSSDPHGKSFSAIMVNIDLPEPEIAHGRKRNINNE